MDIPSRRVLERAVWTPIKDRKILFVRQKGDPLFINPGGERKQYADGVWESDKDTLIRKVSEDLRVRLVPATIVYTGTFELLVEFPGETDKVLLRSRCYFAEWFGKLRPSGDIVEFAWLTGSDKGRLTELAQLTLKWFVDRSAVDDAPEV